MNRADFHGAPYNPRTLDRHAKAKLEKNLKKVGLLQPIVVNSATRNVVAGHQRLKLLDSIEGKQDYDLDVALVDLTEKEERTQNVFMNNASAMGSWDTTALEALLKDVDRSDLPDTGFDATDLQIYFNDDIVAPMFSESKQPDAVKDAMDEIDEISNAADNAKKIEKIKEDKKRARESAKDVDTEIFSVVCFASRAYQTRFVELCGSDSNARYVDGAAVFRLLGINPDDPV
jgi:hypothetical protein